MWAGYFWVSLHVHVSLGNTIGTCDCVCNSLYDLKVEKKKLNPYINWHKIQNLWVCVSQQLCNAVMSWSADDDNDNNGRQQCDLSSGDMCLLRLFLPLSQLCPAVSGVWVLICLLKKSEVNLLSYSEHWAPLSSSFIFAARAALLAGVQVGFWFFLK